MNVLLIGSDSPVGEALQGVFAKWGRHQAQAVSTSASRWRIERKAKKSTRKNKPDAVLDLSFVNRLAGGEPITAEDVDRVHWVAKACEHSGICFFFVSSDQVYAGLTGRALRETDPADASLEPGLRCIEAENRVSQAAPSAIVLRIGPVFDGSGQNTLTRLLRDFASLSVVTLDDRDVYCPLSAADLARVLGAMLDQLSAGAQPRGVFHYSSADRTTEFGFGETVLAAASQFSAVADVVLQAEETQAGEHTHTRVLDCSRLRDTFAIKQVPWRASINHEVRRFYRPD
ncbi:MAG: hypothetical protein Cons2KO_08900 [Congregibacter sp.]